MQWLRWHGEVVVAGTNARMRRLLSVDTAPTLRSRILAALGSMRPVTDTVPSPTGRGQCNRALSPVRRGNFTNYSADTTVKALSFYNNI